MLKTQETNIKIKNNGFTITELLIVVSIVVVLMAVVILAINPGERMAKARDNERGAHLDLIWQAIEQKIYQEGGEWDCDDLPSEPTVIGSNIEEDEYDLFSCLYPNFIADPQFLVDPQTGSFMSIDEYYTGYQIWQSSETETISLCVEPEGQGETRLVYLGDSPVIVGLGEECDLDYNCESGYCVDDFCCNNSCAGDCEACDLTGTEGTCTTREASDNSEVTATCYYCNGISTSSVAYNGDEGLNCTGDCTYCDSGSCVNWPDDTQQEDCITCAVCQSGVCQNITADTDPYDHCDEVDCYTGSCDGSGKCAVYSLGEKGACPECYFCYDSDSECDVVPAGPAPLIDYPPWQECVGGCNTRRCDGTGSCVKTTSVTFTYKGEEVTYGTVEHNNKCWMDRNLGASQVATAYNDSAAYGDLFQWGRCDDGHQTRTSATYVDSVASYECEQGNAWDGDFIKTGGSGSPFDWVSPQHDNLWWDIPGTSPPDNGVNNPCPSSWRIPSESEWETEFASWSEQNYNGAYASPLKLTVGGFRGYGSGSLLSVGEIANYWSCVSSSTNSFYIRFDNSTTGIYDDYRGYGFSVRCLRDQVIIL